jgi:hypothetical protein
MKLERRKFIFLGLTAVSVGLISLPGWYYWKKNKIFASDIEVFFSNYENIVPLEAVSNIDEQASLFESKIILMLSNYGIGKTTSIVNKNIKNEYQSGKLKLINGWIVSETEFKMLILKNKYV